MFLSMIAGFKGLFGPLIPNKRTPVSAFFLQHEMCTNARLFSWDGIAQIILHGLL
jgi:hypothetical protein